MLLKGHLGIRCHSQYNKVIRLLQYSSANINLGDWGCILLDLETIIVLVLLAFNFTPQWSHHSLTLPRSRIRDTATVTTITITVLLLLSYCYMGTPVKPTTRRTTRKILQAKEDSHAPDLHATYLQATDLEASTNYKIQTA